jgi:hypothetical protein
MERSRGWLLVWRLVAPGPLLLLSAGCVTITAPPKNSVVLSPAAASITVNLSQYCDSFKVTLDGTDVTNQFNQLPPSATPSNATLNLAGGDHTLVATANTKQYWILIPYCGSDGDSSNFTVPVTVGSNNGDPNAFPFGGDFPGDTSHHYQQLYMASAFPGPITISALKFFGSTSTTCPQSPPTALPSGNWAIALSTTSVTLNRLSTTYASNFGATSTPVFSGAIAPLAQPWSLSSMLSIPVNPPFTYTPASGNLLIDVMVTNFTQTGCPVYFQATGGGGFNASTVTGHVDDRGPNRGYGLVTEFD